ncbi:hypothetical protein [Alteriqipengyuania lutimaris]|uniref:Phytanoyl-CoA dioxygenase n=1 Tax=Alteriqipengyuania lutimaris TaxID=1538146 RepID=A0A395LGM4_9SPHN|nr:hypothetical protein [Alteriqipengyuania lutimaris]MBB3035139.1 hypothetical protein [Alteriqipengyuania lutimaris]RDS75755.1 hypothetical protein DL238_13715 [Alteriqipengyuania lutimaris]
MTALPETQAAHGAYWDRGYCLIERFYPEEVARGFLIRLKSDLARQGIGMDRLLKEQPLLRQPATELYGYHYPPMATMHWGMTPAVAAIVGRELLPTYSYFRIYREGAICKVHGDRPACEHSVSLTLGYSHGRPWALEMARDPIADPYERADDAFREEEEPAAVSMMPGDAVLYRGVEHHHGRTTPNPNAWSAHLFLHWVDRDGPYAANAFDGNALPDKVDF